MEDNSNQVEELEIEIDDEDDKVGTPDDNEGLNNDQNDTLDNEDDNGQRNKSSSKRKQRLAKQRLARAKSEEMLAELRQQNELLQQQLMEQRKTVGELSTTAQEFKRNQIEKDIAEQSQLLNWYSEQYANAIGTADGTRATQLNAAMMETQQKLAELRQHQNNFKNKQPETFEDPQVVLMKRRNDQLASQWVAKNSDWYNDPSFARERQIALSVNNQIIQEGVYNPATPEFWEELNYRLSNDKRMKYLFEDEEQNINKPQHQRDKVNKAVTGSTGGSGMIGENGKRVLRFEKHLVPMLQHQGILDDKGKIIKGQEQRALRYYNDIQRIRKGE